jgi:hypothetical protein
MLVSRRESFALSSLHDKLRTRQVGVARNMRVLDRRKPIVYHIRSLILSTILLLMMLGVAHPPLAHAGNGYFDMPAQTPELVDSLGVHAGIMGTSFEFAHDAPNTDSNPLFYVGVEAGRSQCSTLTVLQCSGST